MNDQAIRSDIYISADVETDGPVPGSFSLLSFGLTAVGRYDGKTFERYSTGAISLYKEPQPISERFDPEALAVNGLDRELLVEKGLEPRQAMAEAAEWVRSMSENCRPVLVAYPVAFDWSFLCWYFETFAPDGSPFGHSSCLDIRTLYQAIAGTVFDRSGKKTMPYFLRPEHPHTHNSLDDAIEQGELFANLLGWALRRRFESVEGGTDAGAHVPSWLSSHIVPIA